MLLEDFVVASRGQVSRRRALGPVGARILGLIQAPQSVGGIRDRISQEYEVDPRRCQQDVVEFLESLMAEGLLDVSPQILLSSARAWIGCGPASWKPDSFPKVIPWGNLLRSAHQHGLIPLLHRYAGGERLDQAFRENARRSLSLRDELLRILGSLTKAGIPAIPFKGPVLAASFYGDLRLRQFCDLDILIPRRDIPRAKELLRSDGYREAAAARWFDPHCQMMHAERNSAVELHWELMPRFFRVPLDPQGFWDRAGTVSLGEGRVPTFSSEDLLLFLCVHGSKHLWERLAWICDVAQLIRVHPQLDWVRAIRSARRAGAERMLLLGLLLAHDLLGAEIPQQVLQRAGRDRAVKRLTADMKRRFFKGAAGPFGFLEVLPFYVRMRERWRDKIRDTFWHLLVVATPTEKETNLLSLPAFLFPLYCLLRPVRLLVERGRRFLRNAGAEI